VNDLPQKSRAALYEQVARIGKALASPKRLELVDLLCRGEGTVDALAARAGISVKLASAHLKALRQARLVEASRDGKFVRYRLAGPVVADLWTSLRTTAEDRLAELRVALAAIAEHGDELEAIDRADLLRRAAAGEVTVLDVRPEAEFAAAHLPYARSLPLGELRARLAEIPRTIPVVAYCRGPYCLMAADAVALLRDVGFRAVRLPDGVAGWRARGLPIESRA